MPQENKFVPIDTVAPSVLSTKTPKVPVGTKFVPLGLDTGIQVHDFSKDGPEMQDFTRQTAPSNILATGVSKALPMVGGIAGTIVGGPAGGAALSGVGGLAGKALAKSASGDETPTTLEENAKDFAMTAGSQYLGTKFLGPIEGRLMSALGATFFGKGIDKVQQAMNGEEDAPSSLPQEVANFGVDYGKNLLLQLGMEGLIKGGARAFRGKEVPPTSPKTFSNYVTEQNPQTMEEGTGKIRTALTGDSTKKSTMEYGASAQKSLVSNFAKAKAFEKAAYKAFEDTHLAGNTEVIPITKGFEDSKILDPKTGKPSQIPITQDLTIEGPIYTGNSGKLAASFKPTLDKFMQEEAPNLPEYEQRQLRRLQNTVDHLVEGVSSTDATGKPVNIPLTDWKTAKELKTSISKTVGGKVSPTLAQGGLTALASALDTDIDSSIKLWKNGAQALTDLNAANQASRIKNQVFNKEVTSRMFAGGDRRVPADASDTFKKAYQKPEAMARLKTALGPENEAYLKGDYFDNILADKAFGQNYSEFKPRAIINELEDPNSVSRTLYNAEERNGMLRFYRAAESAGESGSLGFKAGQFIMNLGGGLARYGLGAHGISNTTINMGAREFAENIINRPALANIASRLVKVPPDSNEAQSIMKSILQGMRGSVVTVNIDNTPHRALITDMGKIKIEEGKDK